jgi:DNA helicase HerA-like ATPase
MARGRGVVLDRDPHPFHNAVLRPATTGEVSAWFESRRPDRAGLAIGELLLAPGVAAVLDSGALGRHTFLCGQSGSGKTYSLGLLLEQVLAATDLPVVVLDLNSDYVGLGTVRSDADPQAAAAYRHVPDQVAVWTNDPDAGHVLRLRFADLDPDTRAAVLALDPVRDREEYGALTELLRRQRDGRPLVAEADELLTADTPGARGLGLRADNLGVLRWDIWSSALPSLVDELREPTARCTVVDLGSLGTAQEARVVAETVLRVLWEGRLRRRPTLVVMDEAHNVCPGVPADAITGLAAEHAVRIAAEGRKYGLYLLVSTQRPNKIDENVLSQCDNLLLMRMSSEADLADLAHTFSFVSSTLVAGAAGFAMGEMLVAGRFLPQPTYVRTGQRVTEEGGGDVRSDWATLTRR